MGEAAVAAAYAAYRKAYAQRALQEFFRHHFREEWLLKRSVHSSASLLFPCLMLFASYDPSALVAAAQEGREAFLQRVKLWRQWRQDGGVVSYSHDSSVIDHEPLCAEASQQALCSASNCIIFAPSVPASVSRAALQSAFACLAGVNEVIPGPVRADLVRGAFALLFMLRWMKLHTLSVRIRASRAAFGFISRPTPPPPPPPPS